MLNWLRGRRQGRQICHTGARLFFISGVFFRVHVCRVLRSCCGLPSFVQSGKGEHSHQHSSSHNRYQTHPPSCPSRALSHFHFCLYHSCPEPAQGLAGFLLAVGGFVRLPCSASGWARLVCLFPLAGLWGLLPAASPGCCVVVPRQGTAGFLVCAEVA